MDIDVTFLIQLGVFLTLVVSLNGILLKPVLAVIEKREQQTEGADDDAHRLSALGDADMAEYREKMRAARGEALAAREALKEEGRDKEREILAEVRAEITERLTKARKDVGAAETEIRAELTGDAKTLSGELVSKIVGREVAL